MTHPNPFQDSIFDGDLRIAPSSSAVLYPDAEQSLNVLISSLTAKESPDHGYIRLIHCPRAGFGKSHLLAKILSDARQACILPISFNHENLANWQEVFTQTMHCLSRCRKKNVPDVLSETSRLLFAELVGELVQQGIVPSSNPETARHGLQDNYQNMFDLKGAGSPIATWFKANFKALAVPLAGELPGMAMGLMRAKEKNQLYWRVIGRQASGRQAISSISRFRITPVSSDSS